MLTPHSLARIYCFPPRPYCIIPVMMTKDTYKEMEEDNG